MPKLQFGFRLPVSGPVATPQGVVEIAKASERLELDSIWVHDHLTWTTEMHEHHISSGAAEAVRPGQNPDFFEAVTTLAYLAPLARRIKLGMACLVGPLRNPIYAAKQIANLDVFSGGRIILGVGLGSRATRLSREFETLGVNVKMRAPMMDENIAAMREIWGNPRATFHGRFVQFDDAEIFPKPLQRHGPPIWIGGWTEPSRRRAARLGDGWIPGWLSPAEMSDEVPLLREEAKALGRKPDDITIAAEKWFNLASTRDEAIRKSRSTIVDSMENYERQVEAFDEAEEKHIFGSVDDVITKIQRFADAGVSHLEFKAIYPTIDDYLQMMELFVRGVMPSFK